MRFLFFDAAGAVLFERSDPETASVTHEEMTLEALFPYDAGKVVHRGMRVGYEDASGVFQVYEIRKVKTYEPDHYQEVSAEHIAISELTDEFFADAEWTDITASAALAQLLNGTLWSVGVSQVSNTSSANITNGNVWADIRTIEKSWNVHILPRVTVDATGITGRYLDIVSSEGAWRGLRLSLDKNADEMGVTWDDSRLKTALYAFGKTTQTKVDGEKVNAPITFTDVAWEATADHPAKPLGQAYLEDPDATAAYGRNGRARFAYYQNGDISDPEILLQKTWESLKTMNHPDVTIDCLAADLYRLGYNDVPLRLYDMALVEIRPTGDILHKQIIQYTEDLLDPTQSRVSIGTYIPNIVYINRETSKAAGGGGGGGGGQNDGEFEESTFRAWLQINELELSYTAAEVDEINTSLAHEVAQLTIDRNNITALVAGEGAQVGADGKIIVDANGDPVFLGTGNGLYSRMEQTASSIRSTVSAVDGRVSEIKQTVDGITLTGNTITIKGNSIDLDGYVSISSLSAEIASLDSVTVNGLSSTGDISADNMYPNYLEVSGSAEIGGTVSAQVGDFNSIDLNGHTFSNVIVSASVSGNTLTLTPLSGSSVTFSKATTLEGGWGSGTFTVTAKQNTETVGTYSTTIAQGTTTWGDGSPGSSVNGATVSIVATDSGSGGNSYATGRTVYVDATARYTAGVAAGEAKFEQATVTPQGAQDSVYVEAPSGGTDYYTADTAATYYKGDGDKYNATTLYGSDGTAPGLGDSVSYTHYGYVYNSSGTAYSGYGYWFYGGNTSKLYKAGSDIPKRKTSGTSCLVKNSNGSYVLRGAEVSVTPIKADSKKHLLSTIRFKAGAEDTTTYFKKKSATTS